MVIDPVSVHRRVGGTGRTATEHLQRGMLEVSTERLVRRLGTLRDRVETGMDRREFLRTVVSGGFAVGMAQWLGVDDFLAADDGEVPVVTALVRDDPDDPWSVRERTRLVPAEWYAAVEKAFELNDLLARTAFTGYLAVRSFRGTMRAVPRPSPSVSRATVTLSPKCSARWQRGSTSTPRRSSMSRRFRTDPSPGSDLRRRRDRRRRSERRRLRNPVEHGHARAGTVRPRQPAAVLRDGRPRLRRGARRGRRCLLLPRAGDDPVELGTVVRYHPVEDVAAVEPNGWLEPTSRIAAPSQPRVRGQFTKFGLADLVARDEELEKVGALSGHTTGKIQGIDAVTCFTDDFCRRGQIRWGGEMDLTDGDSGSVSYHRDPDGEDGDVLVAGFNNARTWWPGQSYVWGVGAYRLTENHGYHF